MYNTRTMKRIDLYISDTQNVELRQLAKETDVKLSEHVRRAIDDYLKKVKREKKRESLEIQAVSIQA